MALTKLILPGSYDFGVANMQMIKLAQKGLRGNDLAAFIKRAGHQFADRLRGLQLRPGEVPVHTLAIGATEWYGPNRNGDGFDENVCRRFHDTFVKHARWYRNHVNKDPAKSYGFIKYSMYNEDMHRIELLAVLNGTKEAAERNGGLIADEELEKLAAGKDIGVSMACRVPFDICSGCGNQARTRAEYCSGEDEGGHCKFGGLKNRMASVLEDGTQLYARNTIPTFFDLSNVIKPADRIAYVTGQVKAASDSQPGGAWLAEQAGVSAPWSLAIENNDPTAWKFATLLQKLANIESEVAGRGDPADAAFAKNVQPDVCWTDHDCRSRQEVFTALAGQKIAMPLRAFLNFANRGDLLDREEAVRTSLPGVYTRIVEGANIDEILKTAEQFTPSSRIPPVSLRQWAEKRAADYSLEEDSIRRRTWAASLQGAAVPAVRQLPKISLVGEVEKLAQAYALYKAAFLQSIERTDPSFDRTCTLAVRQNYL